VFPPDTAQQHEAKEYKTGKKKSKLLTTCEKLPPESNRPKSFTTGDDHIQTTTTMTTATTLDRQTDALRHVRKRKRKEKNRKKTHTHCRGKKNFFFSKKELFSRRVVKKNGRKSSNESYRTRD
jgi:hypothetical protein